MQRGRVRDERRAPRTRASGSRERAEPGRPRTNPGGAAQRAAHGPDDPVERAAVQAPDAARVEAREPRAVGLDRGPDRLKGRDDVLPAVGDPDRIGWDESQPRAARERLSQAHPRMDPEGLGGMRDLADELFAPGLRRERGWSAQERLAASRRDGELESRKHHADD
jgi:hypothetical protein